MSLLRSLALLALIYSVALVAGFLVYIGLIGSPLLGHISILFYRGIMLAFMAAAIMLLVGIMARRRLRLDLSTMIGATALTLAFNLCFLVVFPVTFDRSITMFLLARVEQRDGQLDARSLEQIFARDYLGAMHQIDRRISEQRLSGNIVVIQGHIHLTPQGRILMNGARAMGRWFGADPRFVGADAPRTRDH